jgi:hypothetical protein
MDELKLWEHRENKEKTTLLRKQLVTMVASLDPDNIEIMDQQELIHSISSSKIRDNIAVNPYEQLQKIAPLMRYYAKHTIDEMKFMTK